MIDYWPWMMDNPLVAAFDSYGSHAVHIIATAQNKTGLSIIHPEVTAQQQNDKPIEWKNRHKIILVSQSNISEQIISPSMVKCCVLTSKHLILLRTFLKSRSGFSVCQSVERSKPLMQRRQRGRDRESVGGGNQSDREGTLSLLSSTHYENNAISIITGIHCIAPQGVRGTHQMTVIYLDTVYTCIYIQLYI